MVQVIENRTALGGVVERVDGDAGAASVTLRVEQADPVPGFANLLEDRRGESITLTLPLDAGQVPPSPGERIRFQARLAGPERYFAVPGTIEPG